MTVVRNRLRSTTGATQAITNTAANRSLLGASLINVAGSINLTPDWLEIVTTASGQYNIVRFLAGAANTKLVETFEFSYTRGADTADVAIAKMRQSTNDSAVLYYRLSTANKFYVMDSGLAAVSSTNLQVQTSPDTAYRVESRVDQASGAVTVNLYTATGTTPLGTWTSSAANLSAYTPNGIEYGNVSSNSAMTIRVRQRQSNDGGTTEFGPWVDAANAAPTAVYDAARTTVAAAGTATATLTGTDSDGSIAGYEHAVDTASVTGYTLSGAAAAQASLIVPNAPGNLIRLKGRVKDDQGAYSAYVTKEICIPTSDSTVGPLPTVEGGWARSGGQTTDGDALASSADTDYLETPAALSGAAQTLRCRLRPMVTRSGTLALIVRLSRTGSAAHAVVRIMQGTISQGTTAIATLASFSVSDTPTNYELDLTSTQVDAITAAAAAGGWNTLFVEIDGLQ